MNKHDKKLLNRVKDNAFKLRKNGQLPYKLYIEVLNLNFDSKIEDVKFLMELCEKYTRVGGFYIRHPECSQECDKELENWLNSKI